jgi:hypothetical protein
MYCLVYKGKIRNSYFQHSLQVSGQGAGLQIRGSSVRIQPGPEFNIGWKAAVGAEDEAVTIPGVQEVPGSVGRAVEGGMVQEERRKTKIS